MSTFFFIIVFSLNVFASQECQKVLSQDLAIQGLENSKSKGVLYHGEHLADLILYAASSGKDQYDYFRSHVENLMKHASKKTKTKTKIEVNEKIDGSPSIILGFFEGKPFVGYKNELKRKRGKQKLIFSVEDAQTHYKGHPLKEIFSELIQAVGPLMLKVPKAYRSLVFQGDLLFSRPEDITKSRKEIKFKPNAIEYSVSSENKFYSDLWRAKVGAVFHTVGTSYLDEQGNLRVSSSEDPQILKKWTNHVNKGDMFVAHPFNNIELKGEIDFIQEIEWLDEIKERLGDLDTDFTKEFNEVLLASIKVFFNSSLKPDGSLGIYHMSSLNEVSGDLGPGLLVDFRDWFIERAASLSFKSYDKKTLLKIEMFLRNHKTQIEAVLDIYSLATRVQHQLIKKMPELFESKIGGVESEGVVLNFEDSVVKLVDRLSFTTRNNQQNNRGDISEPKFDLMSADQGFVDLPHPFKKWRPDSLFVILKGQPFHGGHIEMLRDAITLGKPVFIIASDKGPHLEAEKWNDFKVTETKKALIAGEYKYVFSSYIRRKMLDLGLKETASVHFLNPRWFWDHYLVRAGELGLETSVKLVVGEKEIEEERYKTQLEEYAPHLELVSIPQKKKGLSGSQVRAMLKAGDIKSLHEAFDYIEDEKVRGEILEELLVEWTQVDEKAGQLLGGE